MNNIHHQLARLHGSEHVHTHSLSLDRIGEVFGDLIVNVGIEQSPTYILEGLCDVYLSNFSFALQYFERAFQSVT